MSGNFAHFRRLSSRRTLVAALILGGALISPPPASAAEDLDSAVDGIAKRFVAAQEEVTDEEEGGAPLKVAVTAFMQADRRSTQFRNLVMTALTGKMIDHGDGFFRVLERAQLETVIKGIIEDGTLNPDAAKELGRALGLDTLVVGEITPLTDIVRLDARLVDIESFETIEQAYEWVPLTPTVQRQLETAAVDLRPALAEGDGPDPRNGIWRGTGMCAQTRIGVALSLTLGENNTLTALQTYFPLPGAGDAVQLDPGVLSMAGTLDPNDGTFSLSPTDWLYRPENHEGLGIVGTIDIDGREIRGKYDAEACAGQPVELRKLQR